MTVLELESEYARDARGVYKVGLLQTIKEQGLEIITGAKCLEITKNGVVYEKDGEMHNLKSGSTFYAVGMKPCDGLYFDLAAVGTRVAIAGDCKKVGKVAGAVHSGYFAALDIGKL